MIAITESALKKSKFVPMTLRKFDKMDVDEGYLFIKPPPGSVDEENGDGRMVEIWDYAHDLSWVDAEGREVSTGASTIIYVKANFPVKLKACPLCGGKPSIWQDEEDAPGGPVPTGWVIECRPCVLSLRSTKRDDAIGRWNRRSK